jgi:photosystem II stability/assembly factor-like uncharacterized protein
MRRDLARLALRRRRAGIFLLCCLSQLPDRAIGVERMQPTTGPYGGPVWDLTRTPDGDLYALSLGIFRSPDGGDHWSAVQSVPATGLAASFGGPLYAFGSEGVYRSSSDGREWTRLQRAPAGVRALVFHPSGPGFAGTGRGVFRTRDEGDTWIWTDVPVVPISAVAVGGERRVYAGGDEGIWISRDGGDTWNRFATVPHTVTALVERPDGALYAGAAPEYGSPDPGGVYLVDANGNATVTALRGLDITDFVVRGDEVFASSLGAVPDGLHCCCPGVFRSGDAGATWSLVASGSASVGALVSMADGRLMAATFPLCNDIGSLPSHGILRSDVAGLDWKPANTRLPHAVVYSLASGPDGLVAAAADRTIAWTQDGGRKWTEVATTPPHAPYEGSVAFDLAIHPDGTLFAQAPSGPLFASRDRGATWTEPNPFWQDTARRIFLTPAGTLLGLTGHSVLRSTDQGATWDAVSALSEGFAYDPVDLDSGVSQRVCASVPTGTYLSEDDGLTWRIIANTGGAVAFAPDARTIYIGNYREVLRLREDDGWTQQPLPGLGGVTDLVVGSDGTVYASTGPQVVSWRPGEGAWRNLGGDTCSLYYMGQQLWRSFEYRLVLDSDGYLYLGTECSGVYRSDVSTPVAVQDLTATAGAEGVRLRWRLAPEAEAALRGLFVQRAYIASGPYDDRSATALAPRPAMEFVDTEVVPSSAFWYRLVLETRSGAFELAGPVHVVAGALRDLATTLYQPIEAGGAGPVQIRYRIGPAAARARLAIYDPRGRLVRSLDEGLRPPGEHARAWDRSDASGRRVGRGLYVLHLEAGGIEMAKKFVLLHR